MSEAPRDQNHVPSTLFESSTSPGTVMPGQIDTNTGRILVESSSGSGDVVGPASSTDNAVVRFDGTTGKLIQNSVVIIADTTGNISGAQKITLGAIGVATGSIVIAGTTSGAVTLKVADAAGTWTMTLPIDDGTPNQFLQTDGSGVTTWATPSGTGDVVGPASATDNAVARFDSTTGKLIQNSAVTIADTSGDITAGKYNGLTISASTGTLTIANGKTLTISNTLTFTGTDGSSVAFGAGGTVLYTASTIPLTVGSTTIASGATTKVLFDNSGVLGEYTISGSGNVAMTTSPAFTTPSLGAATATSVNGLIITTTTGTFTLTNAKVFSVTNTLTLSGTDSTVMTFPTTSKTIAANDGSNWTFASQAIGDIIYASSTTAFTRLAAVAVGQVLSSAGTGTAPAWSSAPQITTIELGNASDTTLSRSSGGVLAVEGVVIPSISSTNTLTNKRITPRVTSAASYTTDTGSSLNGDTQDMFIVTAQTGALKFNNPSGTPTDGQKLIITVASSTTAARALTWDTAFGATTVALPTTTAATTVTLSIGFIWSASKSLWQCVAVA